MQQHLLLRRLHLRHQSRHHRHQRVDAELVCVDHVLMTMMRLEVEVQLVLVLVLGPVGVGEVQKRQQVLVCNLQRRQA